MVLIPTPPSSSPGRLRAPRPLSGHWKHRFSALESQSARLDGLVKRAETVALGVRSAFMGVERTTTMREAGPSESNDLVGATMSADHSSTSPSATPTKIACRHINKLAPHLEPEWELRQQEALARDLEFVLAREMSPGARRASAVWQAAQLALQTARRRAAEIDEAHRAQEARALKLEAAQAVRAEQARQRDAIADRVAAGRAAWAARDQQRRMSLSLSDEQVAARLASIRAEHEAKARAAIGKALARWQRGRAARGAASVSTTPPPRPRRGWSISSAASWRQRSLSVSRALATLRPAICTWVASHRERARVAAARATIRLAVSIAVARRRHAAITASTHMTNAVALQHSFVRGPYEPPSAAPPATLALLTQPTEAGRPRRRAMHPALYHDHDTASAFTAWMRFMQHLRHEHLMARDDVRALAAVHSLRAPCDRALCPSPFFLLASRTQTTVLGGTPPPSTTAKHASAPSTPRLHLRKTKHDLTRRPQTEAGARLSHVCQWRTGAGSASHDPIGPASDPPRRASSRTDQALRRQHHSSAALSGHKDVVLPPVASVSQAHVASRRHVAC